jgi:hypothetical protein
MDLIVVLYPVEPLHKLFEPILSSIQIQMRIEAWIGLNKFKKVLLEFLFFSKQEIPSRILRKI